MAEGDFLDDKRRATEEDYFRRKDRELVERMREKASAERARAEISARTGLEDPELLQELHELGFAPDTLAVLPLVPIIQMAWAEGGITPEERALIVKLARERGIADGSAADALLGSWMSHQPSPEVFSRATRLIRAMLDSGAPGTETMSAEELIKYCENIAAASGGFFGIGKISGEERETLAQIAAGLTSRG